ncbi:hypothetical protein ACFYPZ_24625 [Streptomyces sp. NPDC005506]|uniref:hypothetical protein n=1 Tax=Streptomyces sp. NPDC005506 TaxID=3364718 RepID=UPI003693093A
MDVIKDLWSTEFASALIGAVIGGIATFTVAVYQARKSLEALRIQGEDARTLAENERRAAHARESGLLIMDLLLAHRAGLKEDGRNHVWLEEQDPVIDRIRSYARLLPEGEHRKYLLARLADLKRRIPQGYHGVLFRNEMMFMTTVALATVGNFMNGDAHVDRPKVAEIRESWDKADEEAHSRMLAAAANNPLPDDWDGDPGQPQGTPSATS